MNAGQWLQQVTLGWLVFELTGSAFLLGLINAVRLVPFLFTSLISGVMADRLERRRLMLASQVYVLVVTLTIAVVLLLGRAAVWHLFLFTFVSGIGWSFMMTVRQALIPALVPRQDLTNAMALSSAANNLTRLIGPAAGGFLLAAAGAGGNFLVQAGLYAAVVLTITAMRPPPALRGETTKATALASFKDGLRYVRQNRTVFWLLVLALIPMTFALPYTSLLPIFAGDVYGIGPSGLGLLLSVAGLGSLITNLIMASVRESRRYGIVQMVALAGMGLALILFSQAASLPLALLCLVLVGSTQMVYLTLNQTALQLATREDMRGRVMSLFMLNAGLIPLGSFLAGFAASLVGAALTIAAMGALVTVLASLALLRVRHLRAA
jgi:predicted MFS family arabinose efflux permease